MTDAPTSRTTPTIPETARAVRFDGYGHREVLRVEQVPVTPPDAGQVLIAVRACGTNPGEIAIREGYLDDRFPATFPSGQGTDFAGVVAAVGDDVSAFAVGDEVIGWTDGRAAQAEFVTVEPDHLVPKPLRVPWEVAGSLFVAAVTAYAAVRAVDPRAGETVVVSAAAGGVGSLVSQLLRARGVDVLGIASPANDDALRALGVRPVPYGDDLEERIRSAAPGGVDAVIDTYGEEYVHLGVALGVPADRIETIIAYAAAAEIGAHDDGSMTASSPEILAELADLVAEGVLRVEIARTFPLDDVRSAYELLETRHARGKIVLLP